MKFSTLHAIASISTILISQLAFSGCSAAQTIAASAVEHKSISYTKLTEEDVKYADQEELTKLYEATKENPDVFLIQGEGSYNTFSDVVEYQRKQNTQYALLYSAAVKALWEEKKGFTILYPIALRDANITTFEMFQEECEATLYLKGCGNVFKYCADKHRYENEGFIVIEVSDTPKENYTYFDANTLADKVAKEYDYSKVKKPTPEQIEVYKNYKKQMQNLQKKGPASGLVYEKYGSGDE